MSKNVQNARRTGQNSTRCILFLEQRDLKPRELESSISVHSVQFRIFHSKIESTTQKQRLCAFKSPKRTLKASCCQRICRKLRCDRWLLCTDAKTFSQEASFGRTCKPEVSLTLTTWVACLLQRFPCEDHQVCRLRTCTAKTFFLQICQLWQAKGEIQTEIHR